MNETPLKCKQLLTENEWNSTEDYEASDGEMIETTEEYEVGDVRTADFIDVYEDIDVK